MIDSNYAGAFEKLDACVNSGMQPLATYSDEVRTSYRESIIAKVLVGGYVKISIDACRTMLGYPEGQVDEMVTMLKGRGWSVSGSTYLIPCKEEGNAEDEGEETEAEAPDHGDRIRELADIVGFMERSNLNL